MKYLSTAILIVFQLSLTAQLWKDAFHENAGFIDEIIRHSMKKTKVQGMSACLVDSSGIVWEENYGVMDSETGKKTSSSTIYRFASISKLFTGIAIMQLHEQGWLHIDSAANCYIPEFNPQGTAPDSKPITIRSLLTHHSGLPSENWGNVFVNEDFSADSVINYLNSYPVCSEPNKIDAYSNIGYSLLGAVIERISGLSYSTYINQNIFMPLGMYHSSLKLTSEQAPSFSKQYTYNNKEFDEPPLGIIPAGGLYSNITDMAKFAQMALRKGTLGKARILKKETFEMMTAVQNKDVHLDYDKKTGISWHIDADATWEQIGGSISHDGSTRAFHSTIVILPYQGVATVVVANSEPALVPVYISGRQILKLAVAFKGLNSNFPQKKKDSQWSKKSIAPQELNKLEGFYSSGDQTYKIKSKRKRLVLQIGNRTIVLKPDTDSTFQPHFKFLKVIPIYRPNLYTISFDFYKKDTLIILNNGGKELLLASKAPPAPKDVLKKWKNKKGIYTRSKDNLVLNKAKVKIEDGYVYLKTDFGESWLEFIVNPLDKNTGKVNGLGRGTGDAVVFSTEEGNDVLYYAGLKFYKN